MSKNILWDLIENIKNYEAHIQKNEESKIIKREALTAHTDLTVGYFERLWKEKGITEMTDRFCQQMWGGLSLKGRQFLESMNVGVPLFHDIGKINPQFQNHQMDNKKVPDDGVFSCIAGRHSILSSVLYIDYHIQQLKIRVEDKAERNVLRPLILFHAYIIERHHSDLSDFEAFLHSLEEGSGAEIIEILRQGRFAAYKAPCSLTDRGVKMLTSGCRHYSAELTQEKSIALYGYTRILYSLLVAADYYATTEFMSNAQITQSGDLDNIQEWIDIYENTSRMRAIRKYQKEEYPKDRELLNKSRDINQLRTEMLCDAEMVLKKHPGETLFYLEAPTGSGKSNTALDLSFQMIKEDKRLKKIFYIYPFNTLVEQNRKSLEDIYGPDSKVFESIAVINSTTPIKMTQKAKTEESKTESTTYYQKALLDRQFLNYPVILSTHVSLFDIMFGDTKESAFGFHQLMNSIVVLDEIQSYRNLIWGEIICFLKEFSYLLNMKVIIMSATLPNLELLSEQGNQAVMLMKDKDKYFSNPCFKERVKLSYELLGKEDIEEALLEHIKGVVTQGKKILVEFISKRSAEEFYRKLKETEEITCDVEYMSGEDSLMERSRILSKIKEAHKSIILVATQVIEAGVDIDMDIGYKNISKLDSEEQFLGRINRSCFRSGIVYFFKLTDARKVYDKDIRIEKEFTLENDAMRAVLESKDFSDYYRQILAVIKKNYGDQAGEAGLNAFFSEKVGTLCWRDVKERMRLIPEDNWSMSVFLARTLQDQTGAVLDGRSVWESYVDLLRDHSMDYTEKKYKLSVVTAQMNHFIYQIKRNNNLTYNDRIGEIFYISDGEKYFENGKLNRKKVQGELGEFVDFI